MQTKTKNRIVALSLSRSHIVDWQGNSETHFLNPLCSHLDDFLSCFLPYHKEGLHRFKASNGLMASEKFSILITNDFFSITKAVLKITNPVFFDVSEALSRQHNKHVCWHLVQWQYVPFNSGPSRCSGQWLLVIACLWTPRLTAGSGKVRFPQWKIEDSFSCCHTRFEKSF